MRVAARGVACSCRRPGSSGSPAPTSPASSRSTATCTPRFDRLARLGIHRPSVADQARLYRALAPFALRRDAGAAGGGPARRAAALQEARPRRDLAPLRREQHVLPLGARPVDGLHLRGLPEGRRDARGGAGGEVRPRVPQARARARPAAARRRLRLGRPGPARREALRRQRHRRHALRAAGVPGAPRRSSARASATSRRSGTRTTATSPSAGFDAISSIGLTEHIGKDNYAAYFAFLQVAAQPAGPAAQPLHHAHRHRAAHDVQERLHQPLRLPRRRARARRSASSTAIEDQGFEVRHEENLREHYALTLMHWSRNLDEHWDEAVAEVGRRQGAGVEALPRRVADGLRPQHDPAAPGAARSRPTSTATPTCRCASASTPADRSVDAATDRGCRGRRRRGRRRR